jgi:hypothetical protein
MTMKSSVFAISMMAIGTAFSGSAMASEYSESTSQRIAEANRAAAERPVPGVFAEQPPIPDSDVLKDMVQYDATSAKRTASNGSNKIGVDNDGEVTNSSDRD